jgi:hypothetical protein
MRPKFPQTLLRSMHTTAGKNAVDRAGGRKCAGGDAALARTPPSYTQFVLTATAPSNSGGSTSLVMTLVGPELVFVWPSADGGRTKSGTCASSSGLPTAQTPWSSGIFVGRLAVPRWSVAGRRGPQRSEDTRRLSERSEALDPVEQIQQSDCCLRLGIAVWVRSGTRAGAAPGRDTGDTVLSLMTLD